MKRLLCTVSAVLLLMAVCVITPSVSAANTVTLELPFLLTLSGAARQGEYTFVLCAGAEDAPMPAETKDGSCCVSVSEAGKYKFPAITYDTPGTYAYQVYQRPGSDPLCDYDGAVFDVSVTVSTMAEGLEVSAIAFRQGDGEEKTEIPFENVWHKPEPVVDITVVKEWVDDGSDRPEQIAVWLLKDGAVQETVMLSEKNGWSCSWTGLEGTAQWSVAEADVPAGYTASYQIEGNVITITNTASLIETGQLRWPIPVMAAVGVCLVLAGIVLIAMKRKYDDA